MRAGPTREMVSGMEEWRRMDEVYLFSFKDNTLIFIHSGISESALPHLIAPSRIEPARLEDGIPLELVEAANRLIQASGRLGQNLPARTLADLARMVRMMNSYYSNRIKGNNTRPRDIERALAGDFDADPGRRALQQEHTAHVRLQAEIDRRAAEGTLGDPTEPTFIQWLHRDFYKDATEEMLTLRHAGQVVRIAPGEWRQGDVEIGAHVPPPHGVVPAFMAHFHGRFRLDWLHGQVTRVLAMASAHHRFNYIHPFYDGNGRVSRLMSHAMAHHAGIAAGGLWSVSRGLARGLEDGLPGREEYRRMMMLADRVRQGDRDGRGALSLAALVSFTKWFLVVCEDQVRFMAGMRGVKRADDRRVLNGIFWRLRTGAPWADIPVRYGPSTTCVNRFNRWRRAGHWARILQAVSEAYDGDVQMIDSSSIPVHQHGANGPKKGGDPIAWVARAAG